MSQSSQEQPPNNNSENDTATPPPKPASLPEEPKPAPKNLPDLDKTAGIRMAVKHTNNTDPKIREDYIKAMFKRKKK